MRLGLVQNSPRSQIRWVGKRGKTVGVVARATDHAQVESP